MHNKGFVNLRMGRQQDLKVALVTGASGQIGSRISLALAREGWKVGLLCHRQNEVSKDLVRRVQEAGGHAIAVYGDLLRAKTEIPRMVNEVRDVLGDPHYLVHAAGLRVRSSSWFVVPEDLESMFAINVTAYLALAASVLPAMLKAQTGVFLALASQAVYPPMIPGWQAYAVAKTALVQVNNDLASVYGSMGIRAVSILAGAVRSESRLKEQMDGDVIRAMRSRWPIGLDSEKIAELVLEVFHNPKIPSGSAISIDAKDEVQFGRFPAWSKDGSQATSGRLSASDDVANVPAPDTATDAIRSKLRKVMRETFGLEESYSLDKADIGKVTGWDSLGHIRLIMEIEAAFDVQFDSDETSRLHSFSSIADSLSRHLSETNGKHV